MSNEVTVQIIVSEDMEIHQVGQSQMTKVVNPALVMRVPFVPTGLSLAIMVITTGIDFSKEHKMTIKIFDPEKDETLYTTNENTLNLPNIVSDNFNFNLDLKNVPFKHNGMFEVHFILNGETTIHKFKVIGNEDLTVPGTIDGNK
ncbi:hypothetical protein [Carnobacterium sp. ISL-102]|uniref:DUF6941 family protein n=1 Tax=Carnobacterium sp. ISL-102 TaxID=2819142 RepID=UPI001BE7A0BF|nr:hypothetical protein [Carnobacterium sp. ISL-102]MBT2732131.1 hypothetical protein [Carnobacterium sp. ISL-102]